MHGSQRSNSSSCDECCGENSHFTEVGSVQCCCKYNVYALGMLIELNAVENSSAIQARSVFLISRLIFNYTLTLLGFTVL